MHLTLNVEDHDLDHPAKLKRLAHALLALAGEKRPVSDEITLRVNVDTADALKDLQKLREELLEGSGATPREGGLMGNRMAGEGPCVSPDTIVAGKPAADLEIGDFVHLTGSEDSVDPAADDRRFSAIADNTASFKTPGDEDAPPQDDPAAILAAAQAGGAPLDDPAAVLSGAAAQTSISVPEGAAATSTELDASGLPWDERIHASSHAKVANGCWRKRSKLAGGVYEQVEAELRIHYPKPAPALPPPPSGPAGGGSEFAALVQRLHAGFARENDPVTKQQQVDAMKHFGLNGLEDLSKRPDLFEAFAGMLGI